jgi:type II secretory pathway component PulM
MSQFLDKLNLRPQEKRLVVLGSAVLFLVLNFWFVWPHASDLSQVRLRLEQGRRELNIFKTELSRTNDYALRLQELRGLAAGVLAPTEQVTALLSQIQSQAGKSRVNFGAISSPRRGTRTEPTEFFEEQSINLVVNPTGPGEILDFLVALASSDLMIRVKELDLKPDPSQTKLIGSMRLVASFQRISPETGAPGRKS